ncbi:Phosphoenolpyruvate carboxykinase [GTP], partial [hydrothermal vent metagenome]
MFIHDYSLIGRKVISVLISFFFIFTSIIPPQQSYAQVAPQSVLNLPIPGSFVTQTSGFNPAIVEGITLHEDNPLLFDFIVTRGDSGLEKEELKAEANKLIKYFLASLTVPEKDMWVNLSPYEQDRIIPEGFGDTEMGRDLLAQDYMLKQLTASLMYPEEELGRKFWNRVYSRAQQEYGTTQIPVNTFNKVWIVPEKAVVYEHENSAFVVDSHLKVMLEEDYVAINENNVIAEADNNLLQTEIIKEIIIPEIEREVNEGKIFAQLRQIYNSMILATWYKQNLQQSLLGKVYVDQNKTKGVDTQDKDINQKIYNQYVEAFKKGVYNYIKEDIDPVTSEAIPRKYFSGGLGFNGVADSVMEVTNVFNLKYESFINRVSSSSLDNGVYNFQAGIFEDNEKSRLDTSFLPINELKDSNRFAYDFVMEQVAALNAGEIEGVDARDYERLLAEAVDAGELQLTADGNYIANSHSEDVARVEKRTYIATRNEKDKGNNNNWQHTDNLLPKVMEKIQDSYVKKDGAKEKLYFIPYLMGPKGSEFSEVGIQVTNSRYVAISMINMAKVGWDALDHLKGSDNFVKGIHSTGDLENINRSGTEEDDRYFVAFPEEKMIISYGSNYGGNVLLGKKFHSLRMASYKARKEGWLAEHMMIVEVINKKTKEKDYFAGAFPSASGKTNLAMLLPPKILSNDYEVNIIGDDIAWLRPGKDGRLYAINPENGYFGVVPGTNKESNPQFMEAIEKGNSIYTNVAYNEKTKEVWWEGKTKEYPFLRGNGKFWKDWRGHYIIDRKLENRKRKGKDFLWAHANSRVAVASKNMPNLANSYVNGEAVPISGILWGGRVAKLEPLIKELKTIEEGIYDGATMYAEATSASQDVNPGDPVADSMAQKPFFSYHEHEFFQHWLDVIGKLSNPPKFFHINWFRKGDDGEFIWPGFGENLRALIWASERIRGKANYIVTEMGNIPKMDSILLEGVNLTRALKKETFLAKFSGKEKVWNRMIEKGWIFPSEKDSNKMKADPQVIANDPDLGNDLKLDEVILSKIKDFLAISYDVSKNLKDAIYLPSKKKLERELKRRKEYLRGLENKHHKTPAAFLKVEEKLEAAVEAMSGEEEYIVSSSSTTIFQIEERGFEEVSVYVAKRVITLLMEYLNEVVSIEEDKILLADLDQIRYSDEASEIFDILKRVIEYNFLVKFNDKSIYYESGQGRIKNSTESLNSVLAGIKYLLEEELERIDGKILKINGFRVSSLINIKSSSPLSLNYSSPAIEEYVSNLEHPSWSNVKKISNDSKSYLDSLFDKSFVDIGLQYFRQYANWVEVELVDKNGYKYTEKFLNIRVQNLIGNGINKGGDRAETLSQLSNELTEEGKFFLNHLNHII